MKKQLLFVFFLVLLFVSAKAQYVNIPDPNFRDFLKTKYPGCFNAANQMDTNCIAVVSSINTSFYSNASSIASIDGIQYIKNLQELIVNNCQITSVPSFRNPRLKTLTLSGNSYLTSLPSLPDSLTSLDVSHCSLTSLPAVLPPRIYILKASFNNLTGIFSSLPSTMYELDVSYNFQLSSLPGVPNLTILNVESTLLPYVYLSPSLAYFNCSYTPVNLLSTPLPTTLNELHCKGMYLTTLPPLPASLILLDCGENPISALPALPPGLVYLFMNQTNVSCLPALPLTMQGLYVDPSKIHCIPNSAANLQVNGSSNYPVCNVTNNSNGCLASPTMQGYEFFDLNSNGIKDAGEYYKRYGRIDLSSGAFTFTTDSGYYALGADTIGTMSVTAVPQPFFNAVPASTIYNFSTYDTIVTKNIALQPIVSHDSINVTITPIPSRARPGFAFSYWVQYKNAGSTNLPSTTVSLHYNNALLSFTAAGNAAATNTGNTVTLALPSLPVGEFGGFGVYFTVKTTATLGSTLTSYVDMSSGALSSADTSRNIITGSFDPNDKVATPALTPIQVASGSFIDYIIHFQNTGTDTAIHVVITDTLSNLVLPNTLEMVTTSHPCITKVEGNHVSFQMRNIMLPDSNVNEPASHGYIRFRVKPKTTLAVGNTVSNKAAIYFDYNSPVITNTAVTQIVSQSVPLKLVTFSGTRAGKDINLYWYTNNEANTRSFTIEQSSNSRDFSSVGEERAVGFGNNKYRYKLTASLDVDLYYRLKMVDKDGAFSYSRVLMLRDMENEVLTLQENPVHNEITLTSIPRALVGTVGVLVNNTGIVVKRFSLHAGHQVIEVEDLPAGTYYLKSVQASMKVLIVR